MFIVINRFKVIPAMEDTFRSRWLDRDITLHGVPGFVRIQFMKGEARDNHIAYASQTVWASCQAYQEWRESRAFAEAHKDVGGGPALTLERRETGFYEVLKTIEGRHPEPESATIME